jgi:hypothetical protein
MKRQKLTLIVTDVGYEIEYSFNDRSIASVPLPIDGVIAHAAEELVHRFNELQPEE